MVVLPKEEHSFPISMVEVSKEFPIPLVVTKTLWRGFMFGSLCVLRNWEAQLILSDFLLHIFCRRSTNLERFCFIPGSV